MLTETDYADITGQSVPEGFAALAADAETQLHTHTLCAFVGRDLDAMPEIVRLTWQRALSWQVYYLHRQGGTAARAEGLLSAGFTIGDLSVNGAGASGQSAESDTLSPVTRELLPLLMAFGRGARFACG
ncbi:MAG: hypothetical protein ACI4O7_08165 [Aristaeellaceae bacterium]